MKKRSPCSSCNPSSGEEESSMPRISIPTALRQYAGGKDGVDVQGGTVAEGLASLASLYPELKKQLFDAQGKLRSFVNVYVNDEDIRYQKQEETAITDKDDISIIPSIAGGAGGAGGVTVEGR